LEKLHILLAKNRQMLRHGGNNVLLLTYPTIGGDTPAAEHAKNLVAALIDYAKESTAKIATEHLLEALRRGRLFDFSPHTFSISLEEKREKARLTLTLTAHFFVGEQTITKHTLTTHWDENERLQVRQTRARTRKESTIFKLTLARVRKMC